MTKLQIKNKIEIEDKYIDKISIDEDTNLLICKFTTKEEIELFKKEQKIKFKQSNLDTEKGIELENKRISSVLNLRNNLHDVDLPKEYCDKLGIMNAKVIIIESGYNQNGNYREGTAVHISACHSEIGNSLEHINNIMSSFENTLELSVAMQSDKNDRFVFAVKWKEEKIYYLLADLNENDEFEFFDVFIRSVSDLDKKISNLKLIKF